jgi:hypothetical protein
MIKNVLKDEKGMVLVLVLIVLVASIIMGVMIIRSASLESRMAGNERRYLENFADIESAMNLALVQNTASLAAVSDIINSTYVNTSGYLPSGTRVTITLTSIRKPPVGRGFDPSQRARYYNFQATDSEDEQRVTVGAYKIFPPTTQ